MTAIQGQVIGTNDLPVRDAFVFAGGLPDFVVTDYSGQFFFPLVPPNTPIDLTVIYEGRVVGTATTTVAEGEIQQVTIRASVAVEPLPERAIGRIEKPDATTWQYGTHVLKGEDVVCDLCPQPLGSGQEGSVGGAEPGGGANGMVYPGFEPPPTWPVFMALQSNVVNLDAFLGQLVEVVGALVPGYPVDGGPPLLNVTEVWPLAVIASGAATEANAGRPLPQGGRGMASSHLR